MEEQILILLIKRFTLRGKMKIAICDDEAFYREQVLELTQKYALSMQMWQAQIQMSFTKVTAHSNVYYNEMADQLAKQALVDREGVPPIRRREEMEPWKGQD